jgi:hypothetical protein
MTYLRLSLISLAVGFSMLNIAPTPVRANDYWDGYWGWYDSSYAPGYGRYYSSSGPYYGGAYYGGPYNSAPYYGGPYYGGAYYGTPRVGYTNYGYGRSAVRVGPVRFGWR